MMLLASASARSIARGRRRDHRKSLQISVLKIAALTRTPPSRVCEQPKPNAMSCGERCVKTTFFFSNPMPSQKVYDVTSALFAFVYKRSFQLGSVALSTLKRGFS